MNLRTNPSSRPHLLSTLSAAFALAILAAAFPLTGCKKSPTSPATASLRPARPAAEAALDGLLTQYHLQGKVVLVQFGCVGCQLSDEGLTRMIRLQNDKSLPDLAFLRVERSDDASAVDAYYLIKSPPFPVHRDPQSVLANATGATAYPTCLLIDKFGHPRFHGTYPDGPLNAWVTTLLAEKTDPGPSAPLFGVAQLDIPTLLRNTNLPTLASDQTQPLTQYMGQAGLLLVFADTTCPFSTKAIQDLPTVAPKLAARKISTVLINLSDPRDAVQSRFAGNKLGIPILFDVTPATKSQWSIQSVPTLLFISADQQPGYIGPAVWKNLATAIETNLHLAAGSVQLAAEGTGSS